ncbi:HigA family addiction module antitoxin [Allofrancisella frigidaquae]|uniref:Addiction module antidote protein, HigA family n=1 Tax=Allofrancisella frigidaquae TaxID=1085644 RepID=A0A6M3HV29_9GAMM|nr:HigA family addiction module antitoxin [Allofrancisella frigidaquae]KEI35506.1 hypothetical protein FRA_34c07210 [Francisella sp. W12-1067]QIV94930.1 addiction module antidote protein, HigA family [Allofrancisella frigidaquae]
MFIPANRQPTHPGEVLLHEFIEPLGITQKKLAEHLGWTYARLNEIVNGKRGVTADSALSLSETFGVTPDFWLNLQIAYDLYSAKRTHKHVKPLDVA